MHNTLVIQSHRVPLVYSWIKHCLQSVRDWCGLNNYQYQFIGDELFDYLPSDLLKKIHQKKVVASDLARLYALKDGLNKNSTVIWMDADFLIFDPDRFVIPDQPYAVGREAWVQYNPKGSLKVYKKVHNAFLMFRANNVFLDFYLDTAERLLWHNSGDIPPQFIGPKLLTALHNITMLPVLETAGMLSPAVIKDLLKGTGTALDLFIEHSPQPIAAANLCISSCEKNHISEQEMELLIDYLLTDAECFRAEMVN